jgi:lipoic acid synthetase
MNNTPDDLRPPSRLTPDSHQRNAKKLSRIPIKVVNDSPPLRKPDWLRIKVGDLAAVNRVKAVLRQNNLHSVCEEAACPNIFECFAGGTATFMILGDICTRRCPFCDVAHGRPKPPDPLEPDHLATAISQLHLQHVVITSVDRDDLSDGGASQFSQCIKAIRQRSPDTRIEILVPDFRGRESVALAVLGEAPADIFNHNLETVPRLYKAVRPGADFAASLGLLRQHKALYPAVHTKSGIMLGLGETMAEVHDVLAALREHGCDMLTVGQYLQPSADHYPVARYVEPAEFDALARHARSIGFSAVASGVLVRSSYHADHQATAVMGPA